MKNESVPGSPLAQSANTSPRHYIDSSDEEDEEAVELVDEFDKIGGARRSVSILPPPLQSSQLTQAHPFGIHRRDKAKAAPKEKKEKRAAGGGEKKKEKVVKGKKSGGAKEGVLGKAK